MALTVFQINYRVPCPALFPKWINKFSVQSHLPLRSVFSPPATIRPHPNFWRVRRPVVDSFIVQTVVCLSLFLAFPERLDLRGRRSSRIMFAVAIGRVGIKPGDG